MTKRNGQSSRISTKPLLIRKSLRECRKSVSIGTGRPEQEKNQESLEQFIEKIKAYGQIDRLDGYILHDLIKAIYVGAPDRSSGRREQSIHIEYNCVGFIPINGLTEKQTA